MQTIILVKFGAILLDPVSDVTVPIVIYLSKFVYFSQQTHFLESGLLVIFFFLYQAFFFFIII